MYSSWLVPLHSIALASEEDLQNLPYPPQSGPVVVGKTQTATKLKLYQSVGCIDPKVASKDTKEPKQSSKKSNQGGKQLQSFQLGVDTIAYVGGLVSSLAWAPPTHDMQNGPYPRPAYLAVGPHPAPCAGSIAGVPVKGLATIQLWHFNATHKPPLSHAFSLTHNGAYTSHMEWCACPTSFQSPQPLDAERAAAQREHARHTDAGNVAGIGGQVVEVTLTCGQSTSSKRKHAEQVELMTWTGNHGHTQSPHQQHSNQVDGPHGVLMDSVSDTLAGDGGVGEVARLGVLAGCLGDGSIAVWVVPSPECRVWQAFVSQKRAEGGGSEHVPVYHIPPVALLPPPNAIPAAQITRLSWLPSHPHNLLAVSSTRGYIGLIPLHEHHGWGTTNTLHMVSHIQVSPLHLTWINWAPAECGENWREVAGAGALGGTAAEAAVAGSGSGGGDVGACVRDIDTSSTCYVMCGGLRGDVNLCDIRDYSSRCIRYNVTNQSCTAGVWCGDPYALILGTEEGGLLRIDLDPSMKHTGRDKPANASVLFVGSKFNCVRGISYSRRHRSVCFGLENGVVGVAPGHPWQPGKTAVQPIVLGEFRSQVGSDAIHVATSTDIKPMAYVLEGGATEQKQQWQVKLPFQPHAVSVNCVSWCNNLGSEGLVAAGMSSGLLRIMECGVELDRIMWH